MIFFFLIKNTARFIGSVINFTSDVILVSLRYVKSASCIPTATEAGNFRTINKQKLSSMLNDFGTKLR